MMTVISLCGAFLVLLAFIGSNLDRLDPKGFAYSFLNFVGTGLLAITVIDPLNVGVLLIEVIWCIFSGYLILRALKRRPVVNSDRIHQRG